MGILEKVDGVMNSMSEIKSDIGVFGQEMYTKGWDEAMVQAGSAGTSDKIYSEAEMNQIIADEKAKVVSELQPQIDSLKASVDAFPASLEAAKVEAVDGFKAELKAKYDELQVIESQAETGFGDLLK